VPARRTTHVALRTSHFAPRGRVLTDQGQCLAIGYNRLMSRATRIATAAVLALAMAAFPAVLDRCTATCEAHHEAIASTPSCHHVTSTAFRIGRAPTPCGHDHDGTAMTSAKSAAPVGRSIDSIAAVAAVPSPFAPAASERRVLGHAPPGSSPAVDGRSLPLRI
jgi:hypothetical protein